MTISGCYGEKRQRHGMILMAGAKNRQKEREKVNCYMLIYKIKMF